MYVCIEDMCNYVFEEPTEWEESHGLESRPYEKFSACPACGGDYVETKRCDECCDWVISKFVRTGSGGIFCDDCYSIEDIREGRFE